MRLNFVSVTLHIYLTNFVSVTLFYILALFNHFCFCLRLATGGEDCKLAIYEGPPFTFMSSKTVSGIGNIVTQSRVVNIRVEIYYYFFY